MKSLKLAGLILVLMLLVGVVETAADEQEIDHVTYVAVKECIPSNEARIVFDFAIEWRKLRPFPERISLKIEATIKRLFGKESYLELLKRKNITEQTAIQGVLDCVLPKIEKRLFKAGLSRPDVDKKIQEIRAGFSTSL